MSQSHFPIRVTVSPSEKQIAADPTLSPLVLSPHMVPFLFLFLTLTAVVLTERCPPTFGEFECPTGFLCKENQCLTRNGDPSVSCTAEVDCSEGTVCVEGKCYPLTSVKCNRHVLVAEAQAKSIVSDCGKKGKCINGQCVHDRCVGVSCSDGELCRDGQCAKLVDAFCLGHADCGPMMECKSNKCQLRQVEPICNCQPHEICHHGQCYPNSQCTSIYCGPGSYCVEGQCVNAVGLDCREDNCHSNTVCVNGVCVLDQCPGRCPADQDCRQGECRLMEGLPCISECKEPYECVDGRCRRNDCYRKVCQLGEACEGGNCVRVAGRFCTWAPRDCGHAFICKENKCEDLLHVLPPGSDLSQGSGKAKF